MKKFAKKNRNIIIASVLALALIIALAVGLSTAKYKTEKRQSASVKLTATLASKVLIQEHEAERQPDGSYKLNDEIVDENKYELMPGVDIPKDPYITIEGKTNIPAYLYVEVVEPSDFPGAYVKYNLTSKWTKLTTGEGESATPVTGPNGGVMYVYEDVITNENAETTSGGNTTLTPFQILDFVQGSETDTIEVLQGLPRGTTASLDFHAYLVQKYSDDRAANFNGVKDTYATPTPAPSDGSSDTTTSGN